MWWTTQNLDNELTDKNGIVWVFRVWHDHINGIYIQRIFFWTTTKDQSGVIEFKDDQTLHISKLKDRMIKITKNENYRNKFLIPRKHPVQDNYNHYFEL